jgi:sporulation protein YunB
MGLKGGRTVGRIRIGRKRLSFSRPSKKRLFLIAFLIFILLSIQSFIYVEKNLAPALMEIAKVRVKQIATQAINDAISKKIAQNANFKELIDVVMDEQGKVTMMMFNTMEYARIVGETTVRVQNTLHELQQEAQPIPLGVALESNILAMLGPDIPIELVPMGAAYVNLFTKVDEAGINMVLVTVYVRISAEVQIVIPFATENEVIATQIPISFAMVKGDVPDFFYNGNGNPMGNFNNDAEPKINFGPSINPSTN